MAEIPSSTLYYISCGIQKKSVSKSGSGKMKVGIGSEDMIGYLAMRNYAIA